MDDSPHPGSGSRSAEPASARRQAEFEAEALVHLDALYGLALRLTGGDEARAEDLVQEAVLKAYRAWDGFERGTNSRAWLMTILRNAFINDYRKRRRRPQPVELDDDVADRSVFGDLRDVDPEGRFFDRLIDDEVVAAIDELPDEFRIPVVLSDLEGLSYQEVADSMGIPVGTVKSRLFRARKRLQGRLYSYAREMGYLS